MKIVYCTDTICYSGGIQMATIIKANALSALKENEVWILVTDNKYDSIAFIEPCVHVIDLHIDYYNRDCISFFYALKVLFYKRFLHRGRLRKILNDIAPDVVISTGTSEKFFLPFLRVKSQPAFIRELHFEKYYRSKAAHTYFSKKLASLQEWVDYSLLIHAYDKWVVLTQAEIVSDWYNDKNVSAIANPVITKHNCRSLVERPVVIAVGRLVSVKRFDALIRIWANVSVKHPEWTLKIFGNGEQEKFLKEQISSLRLGERVKLMGYTRNPIQEMSHASIYALTSSSEGFPLVVIEAMSVGLPVVAFNCSKGLTSIILDGENGFLLECLKEDIFEQKLCALIESYELRRRMSNAAIKRVKEFDIEAITDQWMCLFQELRNIKFE